MILQSLKLALRHLQGQLLNTMVHVIGLSLGLGICFIIALFIHYEVTFDKYHDNVQQIFRVNTIWQNGEDRSHSFSTPVPLAEVLRKEGTVFEKIVVAHPQSGVVVEVSPEERFLQEKVLIVSPEFVEVFKIEVISGDPHRAIKMPYHAILTETIARKLFGDETALGKTFRYRNEFDITVGAVIEDFPGNTHLKADMLLSYVANEHYLESSLTHWPIVSGTSTFFVLKPGSSLQTVQDHLTQIADQFINSDLNLPRHVKSSFDIIALEDIHFKPEYGGGGPWGGAMNATWLWIFAGIGLAVLFLACTNFVNLSTAQALTRCKEVGVRKSVGAGRVQLIVQFMAEAWILALISGIVAVSAVPVVLPHINGLLQKEILFDLTSSPLLVLGMITGIFVVGLIAGIYPAWVTTRFNPALVLKANLGGVGRPGSRMLRSALMVAQFVVSAGLVATVLLISKQVNFLRNKSLGFDKENVLTVAVPDGKWSPFYTQIQDLPQIQDLSFASATPTATDHWRTVMSKTGADDPARKNVTLILDDDRFAPMYDLELVSGRYHLSSDTNFVGKTVPANEQIMKVIVNETAVKELGFATAGEAVGERFWFGMGNGNAEIVGVVRDFNTTSLHVDISPVLIVSLPFGYHQLGLKIQAGSDITGFISEIEKRFKLMFPDEVFQFSFLDQVIDSLYATETRIYKLFQIFAGLAMLISCLGLWSFASFNLSLRSKEVGMRKVLGASVPQIVMMLSKEFLMLVIIAVAIAFPLVYHILEEWLAQFAFRITIQLQVFMVAALLSITMALLAVITHALRVATSNPVTSLRSE